MGKRKRSLGSAPCLEKRSNSADRQHDNRIIAKGEKIPSQENTIVLSHWYRYGFSAGLHTDDWKQALTTRRENILHFPKLKWSGCWFFIPPNISVDTIVGRTIFKESTACRGWLDFWYAWIWIDQDGKPLDNYDTVSLITPSPLWQNWLWHSPVRAVRFAIYRY